jgi:hypothetical protein
MIRDLAEAGGVIQINFYPLFLDGGFNALLDASGIMKYGERIESEFIADPYSSTKRAAWNKVQDELMALAGDGIYITEVKGLHAGANAVTGDFSIESAGFMIEDGKKTYPIKSFTVAGNFFDMLRDVSALSGEVDVGFSGYGTPDMLVRDMSVAGK